MKKILWLLLSFFSLFGVSCTFADLAGYTITSYDVEMNLYEDGSMDVEEYINVNFSEERRWIYRTIPILWLSIQWLQVLLVQQLHLQIQVLVDEVVDEEVQDFLADEALLEAEVVEDEGGVGKQHTL